ncbi:MAG: ClbS/DfsB family four-helix bundle protein [Chloroflexi bacterium]|nr:ClbS/DfsB family four-helix bundle protein [Chloroflexota bacterium]
MAKQELLAAFEEARNKFLKSIDGLSEDELLQPGAVGYWSVKDVLAHLTAWESELVTALVRIEQGKKDAPNIVAIDDIDDWNEGQYHNNAARQLAIILDDFHGVGKHLKAALEALNNRTLDDNRVFAWMEGEPLSYLVYENAIWHEEEHADEILAWRERKDSDNEAPPW